MDQNVPTMTLQPNTAAVDRDGGDRVLVSRIDIGPYLRQEGRYPSRDVAEAGDKPSRPWRKPLAAIFVSRLLTVAC